MAYFFLPPDVRYEDEPDSLSRLDCDRRAVKMATFLQMQENLPHKIDLGSLEKGETPFQESELRELRFKSIGAARNLMVDQQIWWSNS